MAFDTTPVWQIYNIPQPTFNQGGQQSSQNNNMTSALAPIDNDSTSKGFSQAGKDASILGNLTGSSTLGDAGKSLSGISQGIGSGGILSSLLALI
jgi:hypothetical protein